MIPDPHIRLFHDGDMLVAVWQDFQGVVTSPMGFGATVSQATGNLLSATDEERVDQFGLRKSNKPQMDWQDELYVEWFISELGPAEIEQHMAGDVQSWFITWRHGTMSLQGGSEKDARATAALFMCLYTRGIPCGISRDLACSYFDSRIGRKVQ